ncbi:imelysin family protein [Prosthecomicrobium sp. N25]|uniref:imelysin family protein n=1 Tax=Prosthecomicrobium sp. N25 TaxID=3129254 RepID=UPI003077A893
MALASAAVPSAARGEGGPAPEKLVEIAGRLRDGFAVPRYTALAQAAAAERTAWDAYCAGPRRPAGVDGLKAAFGSVADAWAAVEVLRFGPVAEGQRYERINHWPERRNAVTRGLAGLLAGSGEDGLAPETFAQASAAVQGLAALERLLFDAEAAVQLAAQTPAGVRRCAVGQAIAANLAAVAEAVRAGWAERSDAAARAETPDAAREVLTRAATDVLTLYRALQEQKIGLPLGKSPVEAKPQAAEFARSGRAARTIASNLESLEALAALLIDPALDYRAATLATAASARSIAETMPGDIGPLAAGAKTRSRVVLLKSAVESARQQAEEALPAALGITLGFNSLDGD